MNTAAAGITVAVLLLAGVAGTYRLVRRAMRHESAKDFVIRQAHERAAQAAVSDPAVLAAPENELATDVTAVLTAYLLDNPYLADGFARLDQAIHEQQKGEHQ